MQHFVKQSSVNALLASCIFNKCFSFAMCLKNHSYIQNLQLIYRCCSIIQSWRKRIDKLMNQYCLEVCFSMCYNLKEMVPNKTRVKHAFAQKLTIALDKPYMNSGSTCAHKLNSFKYKCVFIIPMKSTAGKQEQVRHLQLRAGPFPATWCQVGGRSGCLLAGAR